MGTVRKSVMVSLVGMVVAAAATGTTVRQVTSKRTDTVIAMSGARAVVFVPVVDLGWSGSLARNMLVGIARSLGSWGPTDRDRHDYMEVLVLDHAGVKQLTISGMGRFRGIVDDAIFATAAGRLSRCVDVECVPLTRIEEEHFGPKLQGVSSVPPGWSAERLAVAPGHVERVVAVAGRTYVVSLEYERDIERLSVRDDTHRLLAELSIDRGVRGVGRVEYERLFGR